VKGLKIAGAFVAELFGLGCLLKIAFGMDALRKSGLAASGLSTYIVGFAIANVASVLLIWSALSRKSPPPTAGGGA
jgi:hypothetical protein